MANLDDPSRAYPLGGLGSLATLHGYYKSRLSILPDTAPVTLGQLSMPIKVSNDGVLSITDVHFQCIYKKMTTPTGNEFVNVGTSGYPTQDVGEIAPNHPVTLFCTGGPNTGGDIFLTSPPNYIELEIDVSFQPSFYPWRKSEVFQFTGVRAPDGIFHWMPR